MVSPAKMSTPIAEITMIPVEPGATSMMTNSPTIKVMSAARRMGPAFNRLERMVSDSMVSTKKNPVHSARTVPIEPRS